MTNLNYEYAMYKYGVTDRFMSELAVLILDDKNLSEAKASLSENHRIEHLSFEKIYVLAASIASSIMGDDISLLAPRMYEERESIRLSTIPKSFAGKKRQSYGIVEDFFEEIENEMNEVKELYI